MSTRLDPSTAGVSAQVNARMTPDLLAIIDAEVVRIHRATTEPCDRSRALRAIVRAHVPGGAMADNSVARQERDEARAHAITLVKERDTARADAVRLGEERDDAIIERDAARGEVDALRAEIAALRSELLAATLRTNVPQEVPARRPREKAPVGPSSVPSAAPAVATPATDHVIADTALRARWTALKVPLRPFVARYGVTRTPFQKWAAGRVASPAMLAEYTAAITAEEASRAL